MPCRSDYMEATAWEKELGLVLSLLAELDEKPFDHKQSLSLGYGNHRDNLDLKTAELCLRLGARDIVGKYSLEMQIWWRDHQAVDARRVAREKAEAEREERVARETYEMLKKRFGDW